MNYLTHLFLSDPTPGCRVGNLIADSVKGPITDEWPIDIARGLRQHRQLDVFAHQHPVYQRSRRRLDPRYGLCRGVMIDIFYDHFLASDWVRYSQRPLAEYADEAYRLLEEYDEQLPANFRPVAARMIEHDWLTAYRQVKVIAIVLERVAGRLTRFTPMANGIGALLDNYEELRLDCHEFLAAARAEIGTSHF